MAQVLAILIATGCWIKTDKSGFLVISFIEPDGFTSDDHIVDVEVIV